MTDTIEKRLDAVVERQFEAINRHDAEAFALSYSTDAVVFDPVYQEALKGREAIARDMTEFFAAFPDLRVELHQTVGNDQGYGLEFSMTGTHKGPLVGPTGHIPPTGRSIHVRGGNFARLDSEGRITDERRYYDLAGLLGQLGLMA